MKTRLSVVKKTYESLSDVLFFLIFLGTVSFIMLVYILPIAVIQSLTEWLKEKRI